MFTEKPKILTISNINKFFDFKGTSLAGVKPGMFLSFNYNSPDGVHDKKPLVFVLETKGDRVWGLNFHYNFSLMGELIKLKEEEITKFVISSSEYKKTQKKEVDLEELSEGIPNVSEITSEFDIKKMRLPVNLLENFANGKINPPITMLRNYLFNRMRGVQKLVFKV